MFSKLDENTIKFPFYHCCKYIQADHIDRDINPLSRTEWIERCVYIKLRGVVYAVRAIRQTIPPFI